MSYDWAMFDRDRLLRVHAIAALLLVVGVVVYVFLTGAVVSGRDAYAARLTSSGMAPLQILLLVLALVTAVAYVALAQRGQYLQPDAGRALRIIHGVTGAVAVAFLAFHAWHLWEPVYTAALHAPHAPAEQLYAGRVGFAIMNVDLARPIFTVVYVVGVTVVAYQCYVLAAAASTWLLSTRSSEPARGYRIGAGLIGGTLWLVAINAMSAFSGGVALVH